MMVTEGGPSPRPAAETWSEVWAMPLNSGHGGSGPHSVVFALQFGRKAPTSIYST